MLVRLPFFHCLRHFVSMMIFISYKHQCCPSNETECRLHSGILTFLQAAHGVLYQLQRWVWVASIYFLSFDWLRKKLHSHFVPWYMKCTGWLVGTVLSLWVVVCPKDREDVLFPCLIVGWQVTPKTFVCQPKGALEAELERTEGCKDKSAWELAIPIPILKDVKLLFFS